MEVTIMGADADYAKQTRNFHEDLTVSIKGATVEGSFDRYTVMTWIDYAVVVFFGIEKLSNSIRMPMFSSSTTAIEFII